MRLTLCASVLAALLPALRGHADVDLWPLLVVSEEETAFLHPLFVRERQWVEVKSVGTDRVDLWLGSEDEGHMETIEPGGSFGAHSFDALARHGPGRIRAPDFLMLFPFYYRTNYARDQHVLWPLFKTSEGVLERAAPLWFRGENSYTLLPILHRTPDYMLFLVPPVYLDRQGPTRAVFPLFLRTEHELYALPGYYRGRKPGQPARDVLLPFYGWSRDDSTSQLVAAAGLYARIRRPDLTIDWLFPFYYRERAEGHVHTGLLFPLYYQIRGPERSATWVLPVWRDRTPELSRTWVLPLWLSEREELSGGREIRSALSVLWPIFSREVVRAEDGELLERHRRFLIFSDHRKRDGGRSFSILGIVVTEQL